MNLIPESDRSAYSGIFQSLHDTWARDVVIFKTEQQVLVASNPEYSAFYQQDLQKTVEFIPVSGSFKARLQYGKINENDQMFVNHAVKDEQLRITQDEIILRMKVTKDAVDFIKDAKEIQVDGNSFIIAYPARPHGFIGGPQFYTYYLKQSL